jgi:hypothetical protein
MQRHKRSLGSSPNRSSSRNLPATNSTRKLRHHTHRRRRNRRISKQHLHNHISKLNSTDISTCLFPLLFLSELFIMIDFTKLSPAELRALAYGLTVLLKLNDNFVIAVNEKGESFAVYSLPEPQKKQRSFWARVFGAPECVKLCGYTLLRRHLTCWVCRFKKIKEGKLPAVVPVTVYFLAMGKNRRFERLQKWLVKKQLAIVEFTALAGENSKS